MPTENRSSCNHGTRTFTLDSLTAALEQVQALHEISADLIAENVFGQPAQQGQGEPVVLPDRHVHEHHGCFLSERQHGWNACLDEIAKLGPLYTHPAPVQGEPVAWLNTATGAVTASPVQVMDWDDESEPVQALYTHADPAEVERLRSMFDKTDADLRSVTAERHTLIAQVADLREMLRMARGSDDVSAADCRRIDSALSASAEPSASVEPVCNCATRLDTNHALSCPRAALERRSS